MGELQNKVQAGCYLFPNHIPVSLEAIVFIDECLQYSLQDRLTMDQLFNHIYFKPSNQEPIPFNKEDPKYANVEITSYR